MAENFMAPIAKEEGVKITHKMDFGNIKNRIENKITDFQPAMVILGRRKPKLLPRIGDGVTPISNYRVIFERYFL